MVNPQTHIISFHSAWAFVYFPSCTPYVPTQAVSWAILTQNLRPTVPTLTFFSPWSCSKSNSYSWHIGFTLRVPRTFGLDFFSASCRDSNFRLKVHHVKAKTSPSLLVIKGESPPWSWVWAWIHHSSVFGVRSLTGWQRLKHLWVYVSSVLGSYSHYLINKMLQLQLPLTQDTWPVSDMHSVVWKVMCDFMDKLVRSMGRSLQGLFWCWIWHYHVCTKTYWFLMHQVLTWEVWRWIPHQMLSAGGKWFFNHSCSYYDFSDMI